MARAEGALTPMFGGEVEIPLFEAAGASTRIATLLVATTHFHPGIAIDLRGPALASFGRSGIGAYDRLARHGRQAREEGARQHRICQSILEKAANAFVVRVAD